MTFGAHERVGVKVFQGQVVIGGHPARCQAQSLVSEPRTGEEHGAMGVLQQISSLRGVLI